MQWGSENTSIDRKKHSVKLTGNAYVYRENEVLRSDYIELDTLNETVHAEGRVEYQYADYYIRADSIDLDLRSKTGTVINGNMSNGQFALRGSRIEQKELGHFIVTDYSYTTCHDCPSSWDMTGKKGDFTVDGYAIMHDFVFKIKDTSFFYLPFMMIPIKTRRQSGFLFPRFGGGDAYGAFFVEPYYWAINHWSDLTVGVGYYSARGVRFETEARYSLTDRSQGIVDFFWTRDNEIRDLYFRYAAKVAITQELPFEFEGKLRINEVSDSGYPIRYAEDIAGRQEAVLASDLFFSRNDPGLSTTISFRRIRNLLYFDNEIEDPQVKKNFVGGLDTRTVQEFPRIVVNSNDRFVFGQKFAFGVEARFNRFTRIAGPLDFIPSPTIGAEPTVVMREANRFTLIPGLYTTLNPWPWLSLVPSLQYRSFFYNFDGVSRYPNLVRGYLLGQAEMSFQLERFYSTANPDVSYKHTIRPTFTYSVIPDFGIIEPSTHPFIEQVQNKALSGSYFDNSDIVPQKTTQNLDSYFTPLGNSLTYGLVTQVFKKERQANGGTKVNRRFEGGITQTLDLLEAKKALNNVNFDDRVILSPLFTHFIYQTDSFYGGFDYTYFSFLDRYTRLSSTLLKFPSPHRLSTTLAWTLEHSVRQGVLVFDRSVYLNYTLSKITARTSSLQVGGNFSINDYIMPKGSLSYNLVTHADRPLLEAIGSVLFQNPSKCWQIEFGLSQSIDRGAGIIFNFALNMTGNSFASVDDTLKK